VRDHGTVSIDYSTEYSEEERSGEVAGGQGREQGREEGREQGWEQAPRDAGAAQALCERGGRASPVARQWSSSTRGRGSTAWRSWARDGGVRARQPSGGTFGEVYFGSCAAEGGACSGWLSSAGWGTSGTPGSTLTEGLDAGDGRSQGKEEG